jgi:type IV fimbrial biogenesis protein FimT
MVDMQKREGATLQHQYVCPRPVGLRGFTLVELMVTVAVLGILAVVAVPAMTGMINNSRLRGQAEEVAAALQLARSEAVRRNQRITACASASGTSCAASASRLVVYWQDPSNAANTEMVREIAMPGSVQISGPAAGIQFRSTGLADSAQQLQITVSGDTRYVCVQISGVVSLKKVVCS